MKKVQFKNILTTEYPYDLAIDHSNREGGERGRERERERQKERQGGEGDIVLERERQKVWVGGIIVVLLSVLFVTLSVHDNVPWL